MCGNGIRCVGKYVYDRGLVKKDVITVETLSGIKTLYLNIEGAPSKPCASIWQANPYARRNPGQAAGGQNCQPTG